MGPKSTTQLTNARHEVMGYFVALYSLASYATDGVGLSQTKGAALQSILAAGQMIGRPLCGLALDKGGRLNMAIVTNLVAGLSCLAIWLQARSFGVLVVFSIIQGAVGGTVWSAAAPVAARTVGVTHVGSALAMFWLSIVFPVTVAQPIAVALIDYSRAGLGRKGPDAYMISIGLCGGLFCLSSVVLFGGKIALQRSFKLLQKI
jgi:MFS family permease